MQVGIGLPSTIPGVEPTTVLQWAKDAEARGFSTVGVLDRLVYPNLDPLTMLAAAAVVTSRVRLISGVLVAPIRTNAPAFAKQAATIDRLAGGRLVLGVGVGSRADDYEIAGLDFHRRGKAFDAQLAEVTAIWQGSHPRLGPVPATEGGPTLIFGGTSPATFRRMVAYGAGWFASSGTAEGFAQGRDLALEAWSNAGREGRPHLVAHCYAGAGPLAFDAANVYLRDYYAHRVSDLDAIVGAVLLGADAIHERLEQMRAAGCDEFILTPVSQDLSEVHLMADAAGL
jgi:alkanesulfonate monooxygenase SsuD/methylene tetrahydromethanopterin reductase-like flavin-dependent oxidoreductase (luciferase family)